MLVKNGKAEIADQRGLIFCLFRAIFPVRAKYTARIDFANYADIIAPWKRRY
jgi:hypothetical protein